MGDRWLEAGMEGVLGLQAGRWCSVTPDLDGGSTTRLSWNGRSSGAAGCNEFKSSRPRRWELGGSRQGLNDLIDSKVGQRKLGGSRLRSMAQPQVVRRGSRIQRTEGAWKLRVEAEEAHRHQAEE